MLVIRLSRRGRKKQPTYRLVLQERDWAPTSKVIETLGSYNPNTNPATIEFDAERIQYWISQGAQTSTTVHNMLVTAGVVKGEKRRAVFGKKDQTEEEIAAEKADAKPTEEKPTETAEVTEEAPEEKTEEAPAKETTEKPTEEKPEEKIEEQVEVVEENGEEKTNADAEQETQKNK